MLPGKLAKGWGSAFAAAAAMVWSVVIAPVEGLNKVKLVVVTTSALSSIPNATPSGGLFKAKVWMALALVRSISERTLFGEAGAVLLPKCAMASQWPSGDIDSELGCGATLIEV